MLKGEKKLEDQLQMCLWSMHFQLTLLTAHKHFHQFEILEALRLPKDAIYQCSFWMKYSFVRCLR